MKKRILTGGAEHVAKEIEEDSASTGVNIGKCGETMLRVIAGKLFQN